MNHPDEKVFLLGVGEELHIALSAVMAHHGEARHCKFLAGAGIFLHLGKAPIHLECFTGTGSVPASTVALRSHHLPLCGDKIPMRGNVVLDGGDSSRISLGLNALKAHGRVRDAVAQHGVERVRESRQNGLFSFASLVGMSFELEAVLFQTPQLRTAHTGTTLKLGKINLLQREAFSRLPAHFVECLGDPSLVIQIAFYIFHCTSFPEPLSAQV